MSITGERIKAARIAAKMTQEELGEKIGVQKAAIHKYETGLIINLKRSVIEALAEVLNVKPSYLMGYDEESLPSNILPIKRKKVPLLGSIAAGVPIYAEEDHESFVLADEDVRCDFALCVEGDSMLPRLQTDDIVFLREQPDVDDGKATVKLGNHIRKAVLSRYGVSTLREVPKHEYNVALQQIGMWNDMLTVRDVVKEARSRAESAEQSAGMDG